MPELKRNFMQGRMNKDLDERLVSDGEYRDALNIQVSTAEGSDIGSARNLPSNKSLGLLTYETPYYISEGAIQQPQSVVPGGQTPRRGGNSYDSLRGFGSTALSPNGEVVGATRDTKIIKYTLL